AFEGIGYKTTTPHDVTVVSSRAARLRHGTALLPRRSDRVGGGPGIVPGTLLAPRARRVLPLHGLQALRRPGLALPVPDRASAVLEARQDLARRAGSDADHADRYPRRGRSQGLDAAGPGEPAREPPISGHRQDHGERRAGGDPADRHPGREVDTLTR